MATVRAQIQIARTRVRLKENWSSYVRVLQSVRESTVVQISRTDYRDCLFLSHPNCIAVHRHRNRD